MPAPSDPLVIVGGTGPLGSGLAMRFAAAGESLVIGSRERSRAEATATAVRTAVPGARVEGLENSEAIGRGERVVLAFPAAGLTAMLDAVAASLSGKIVIDAVVPMSMHHGFAEVMQLPAALSAGEYIQEHAPGARVVSAFKNVPASKLENLGEPLAGDVLVCGDDAGARTAVCELVRRLPGIRAVDAGALANARYLEAITCLLVNLNRQHKAHTSIAIVGL